MKTSVLIDKLTELMRKYGDQKVQFSAVSPDETIDNLSVDIDCICVALLQNNNVKSFLIADRETALAFSEGT